MRITITFSLFDWFALGWGRFNSGFAGQPTRVYFLGFGGFIISVERRLSPCEEEA